MNLATIIAIIVIMILLILAIRYIKKHGPCGNCPYSGSCSGKCEKNQ